MSTLETRYRRLLALYPAEHRRLFGDEMLGVLMSGAEEGQRRPRLGESVDLMWHALWRRLGGAMRPRTHGHWAHAASVVGVVGPLSLFVLYLRTVVGYGGVSVPEASQAMGSFLLLALSVLFGPRWLVVPIVWVVALIELGAPIPLIPSDWISGHDPVLGPWTSPLLALTTAVALSVPQPARGGLRLLGGRGVAALFAVALMVGGSVIFGGLVSVMMPLGEGGYTVASGVGGLYLSLILGVAALIAGTAVLWRRLDGPVRRRVIVILAPAGVMYLVEIEFAFLFGLVAVWQSFVLHVSLAVLCFALLKPWERVMRLIALGRQAEREAGGDVDRDSRVDPQAH